MREKVLVIYGGFSLERKISLISGQRVSRALKKLGYQVTAFDLQRENLTSLLNLKGHDLAFIALHGKFGEDGKVQSLLDLLGIKYTGSNALTSAICFNKNITYRLTNGITSQPKHIKLSSCNDAEISNWKHFPAIVKPNAEGSSIGIELIRDPKMLKSSLIKATRSYGEVLLEEFISGRELSISVLEMNARPVVLPILEINPKRDFYDYEAKYTRGLTEFTVPASLSANQVRRLEELSCDIFSSLGCRHMIRIDGIFSEDEFYFLEVNTIPGLTELSDLPQSATAFGMNFEELINTIVREALEEKEVPQWNKCMEQL
ncbi:D-alanyl-alanine synthetase A [Kosmotoga arenicorallina S304]|uniref:D-alanine--D-alanine ligase n=1 Tax=Kosmotoga arenicorallina S304 TaxID=1453497 RepID=A0A176K1Y6_9BACT|nr:D-alanine--D-alanine ligase [Kosmotoga arenicorallina]OAA31205.1 D-alanyl-alanine synthetase A [Kosmotoga arenicorallina S304]